MSENWPIATNSEGWINSISKRIIALERRGGVRSASEILGPGLAPKAVMVNDWNSDVTLFNGMLYSEPGALNVPDNVAKTKYWMGSSTSTPDGYGFQKVWEYRSATTPLAVSERTFAPTANGTRTFGPWDGVWIVPTLLSPWSIYGSTWAQPRYMKREGMVYVEGLILQPSNVANDIFVLPPGFRPLAGLIFSQLGAAPTENVARVDVVANGTVRFQFGAGSAFLSLTGITFPAEQ